MKRTSSAGVFQVEPGRPKDIFFFISEVVSGAWRERFGNQFCSLPMTEKDFGIRCAKAILERLVPFWRPTTRRQFVVVRHQHEIVGAALSHASTLQNVAPLTSIDVVVVAKNWRHQGIGQALVTYFQNSTPPGALLECYCLPKSRAMARLVEHLGFIRTRKSTKLAMANGYIALRPERWEWQARCASRSLDYKPRQANIEKKHMVDRA